MRPSGSRPGRVPRPALRLLLLPLAIAVASAGLFAYRLDDEPMFMDESAFLSQAYFGDLLLAGRWDSPLWLEYAAYDLPPLPKYLINLSLRFNGQPRPPREWAIRWYFQPGEARFVTPASLRAARLPSILMGALGCVAVYFLGASCGDRRAGLVAATLLALNPLYMLHARRAMADVPAEALVLASAALGIVLIARLRKGSLGGVPSMAMSVAVGAIAGLAVLAKLNGGLGLILVALWTAGAAATRPAATGRWRLAAALGLVGATALVTFIALNPFVTANPATADPSILMAPKPADQSIPMRLWEVVRHRIDVSSEGQKREGLAKDALPTLRSKAAVLVVQGFGRFGPLGPRHSDSTRRYDLSQDWGVIAWMPIVLVGFFAWIPRGFAQGRRGEPPTAWAIPLGFAACVATVALFLPMAWDRYMLPIQSFSALMAAGTLVAIYDRLSARGGAFVKPWRGPVGVFLVLMASYAYFWHSRDWNAATRLMLTYSLVDRGTTRINGLEDHTGDRARIGDRYYTDKQPGLSLLGVPAYAAARHVFGMAPHPVDRKGPEFPYWPGDYWVTLATSGLLTALCGALLTRMAAGLGCGPRRAILVGLAYGLCTPAYIYATLFYGHQAAAFLLLASLAAILKCCRSWRWSFLAGLCASYAAVVEIQTGPVSAILGSALLGRVVSGRVRPLALAGFAAGAIAPVAVLAAYNVASFGSPFDMGYFHEDLNEFRQVHSEDNPLGLGRIHLGLVPALLWGEFRGLLAYAPILALAVPGWLVLARRGQWTVLIVTLASCASVFLVNLSYPKWTGGWSTGPRFLLPMVPFAMLAVASALSLGWRSVVAVASILAVLGGVAMFLFQGVGGRIPDAEAPIYQHPLREVVWPMWRGDPLPAWKEGFREGSRFERTLGDRFLANRVATLGIGWRWLQFAPFVLIQIASLVLILKSDHS